MRVGHARATNDARSEAQSAVQGHFMTCIMLACAITCATTAYWKCNFLSTESSKGNDSGYVRKRYEHLSIASRIKELYLLQNFALSWYVANTNNKTIT